MKNPLRFSDITIIANGFDINLYTLTRHTGETPQTFILKGIQHPIPNVYFKESISLTFPQLSFNSSQYTGNNPRKNKKGQINVNLTLYSSLNFGLHFVHRKNFQHHWKQLHTQYVPVYHPCLKIV